MLTNYLNYLISINQKLTQFFEAQSPYIRCVKGCAKCCQDGEYPFSKVEFDFLMFGFSKLPVELQQEILEKVEKIKADKQVSDKEEFLYECPFLVNNECSVYEYRGIICRVFGLLSHKEGQKPKIPFCAHHGLNYSNVLDAETGVISSEKYKSLNVENPPLAYNVSYSFLTSENFAHAYGFEFGEKRPLIGWFTD